MSGEITIEDLRRYRGLQENIRVIEAEIKSMYYPIHSPSLASTGKPTEAGDPTVKAVRRILAKRETLSRKYDELDAEAHRIEEWTSNLEDDHIAAIVRCHYLNGLSWKETASIVYDTADKDAPRKAINRFFKEK